MRIFPILLVGLFSFASLSSFADEADYTRADGEPDYKRAEGEPDYTVEVDSRVYPKKAFDKKGVKTGEIPGRVKRPDALPDKKQREEVFARVPGLGSEVAKMDEMDRDLLFVRARTKPLKELAKTYPGIGEKTLARLQKELGVK